MRELIVHIAREDEWRAAQPSGDYVPFEFARDGFVHLSTVELVHLPANALFARRPGLVLLWVDPSRLAAELRYEPPAPDTPADALRFPHLYGPLNVDAVVATAPLEPWEPGAFRLPPAPA